jgi:hypothetical protein
VLIVCMPSNQVLWNIYVEVRVPWMENNLPGYFALCKYWASLEFIEISKKRRQNRGHEPKHTYGTDGHTCKALKMVRNSNLTMFSNLHIYKTNSILQSVATGVDPSDIKVFVEHHKGCDPTNPGQLSTTSATTALVIYFHFLLDSCVVLPL